ncbi:MAG TPA: hypothetical protein VIY96_11110 [Thermoanaerobaculia bacterium]
MKSFAMFLAVAIGAVAAIAATEDAAATRITVTGDVVRYEAGRTIVVRSSDGRDLTYTIAPSLVVPADVAVGRRVAIVTEPSQSGAVLVTRISTETAPSATESKSQVTTISGTVSAYEPGRLITVLRPNATTVTYTIDTSSGIPTGLEKGSKVVVRTITRPGVERPLVRKVTYSKTTKKTKK